MVTKMVTKTVKQGVKMSLALMMATGGTVSAGDEQPTNTTKLYFGDTHLHTYYSPDAFFMGNRSTSPDEAYRFAKGLPIVHPYHRARIQLKTPLDFLIVSDHAELMGVPYKLFNLDCRLVNTEGGRRYLKMAMEGQMQKGFYDFIGSAIDEGKIPEGFEEADLNGVVMDVWQDIIETADRHNDPGKFTTFIGWEWTSMPDKNNLHRIVFMDQDKEIAKQFQPYGAIEESSNAPTKNQNPEQLWAWLEEKSQLGTDFIAMPHNSNISNGLMFSTVDSSGGEFTAGYAKTRIRWEPVVEVTQIKGDSETHPCLSPDDQFADFETLPKEACSGGPELTKGSYIRSALMRGLEIREELGSNPYKFGLIGSTDSHTGASTAEEDNFGGKMAIDSIPEETWKNLIYTFKGSDMSASGLAAVWAEENTRESIFAAFKRKEVYATTGTRLQVRFFGGWRFTNADIAESIHDISEPGYQKGNPMGGDINNASSGDTSSPTFIMEAVKDPKGVNLERIQIIKGWVENGSASESVYDVKLSVKKSLPAGEPVLRAFWTDPDFDSSEAAFYYVRVLEQPTYRQTTYDLLAMGCIDENGGLKETRSEDCPDSLEQPLKIQERAYTSPIWYMPVDFR